MKEAYGVFSTNFKLFLFSPLNKSSYRIKSQSVWNILESIHLSRYTFKNADRWFVRSQFSHPSKRLRKKSLNEEEKFNKLV